MGEQPSKYIAPDLSAQADAVADTLRHCGAAPEPLQCLLFTPGLLLRFRGIWPVLMGGWVGGCGQAQPPFDTCWTPLGDSGNSGVNMAYREEVLAPSATGVRSATSWTPVRYAVYPWVATVTQGYKAGIEGEVAVPGYR